MINKFELYKLFEDKTRFIKSLPTNDDEKNDMIQFFKSHSTLESKIDWNEKDKESLVIQIRYLMLTTLKNAEEKEKKKRGYRGDIDWESHNCKYLGKIGEWDYIAPLSYEGAVFCDSAECGGAPAKWCIGYEHSDSYWNNYISAGNIFMMKINFNAKDKMNDLKYMYQIYPFRVKRIYATIWDQTDKSSNENHNLTEEEISFLKEIPLYNEFENSKFNILYNLIHNDNALYSHSFEELKKKVKDVMVSPKEGTFIVKDFRIFFCSPFATVAMCRDALKNNSFELLEKCAYAYKMLKTEATTIILDPSILNTPHTVGGADVIAGMFSEFQHLAKVDFNNIKLPSNSTAGMFLECYNLKRVLNADFSNIINTDDMFSNSGIEYLDCSTFYNVESARRMFFVSNISVIKNPNFKKLKDAEKMFNLAQDLIYLDMKNFESLEKAESMFSQCKSLQSIENPDFSKLKFADKMFFGCESLKNLDLSTISADRFNSDPEFFDLFGNKNFSLLGHYINKK